MLLICSDQERLLLSVTPRNLRDVTMGIEDPFKLRRKVGVWRLREKVTALVFITLSLREFALAQLSTLTISFCKAVRSKSVVMGLYRTMSSQRDVKY